jgi:hypothetical protein
MAQVIESLPQRCPFDRNIYRFAWPYLKSLKRLGEGQSQLHECDR